MRRAVLALLLVGLGCASENAPAAGVRLGVRESADFGRYLTDEAGRAVYIASSDSDKQSACVEQCEEVWEPVPGSNPALESAEPAVQHQLVGSIVRPDGRRQITYANRPLYYRRGEQLETQRSFDDRWGHWSLVFPFGEPMDPKE